MESHLVLAPWLSHFLVLPKVLSGCFVVNQTTLAGDMSLVGYQEVPRRRDIRPRNRKQNMFSQRNHPALSARHYFNTFKIGRRRIEVLFRSNLTPNSNLLIPKYVRINGAPWETGLIRSIQVVDNCFRFSIEVKISSLAAVGKLGGHLEMTS